MVQVEKIHGQLTQRAGRGCYSNHHDNNHFDETNISKGQGRKKKRKNETAEVLYNKDDGCCCDFICLLQEDNNSVTVMTWVAN